ncbi:hypothetical protein QMK38_00975 [Lysinibacillus fusiformis]|nr:hypothetical protein [Lysinibacillus fusiformis]
MDKYLNLTSREKYKLLRKRKKINLIHIAKQIGVSVPMLSMYENQLKNLSEEKEIQYQRIIINNSIFIEGDDIDEEN